MNKLLIVDAQDILADARGCINCISAAASGPVCDNDAFVSVANAAVDKINKALALLDEYRGVAETEDHPS
jgi:hypothetical protein